MVDMSLDLSRITYQLEEEPVRVIPLKSLPNLRLDGLNLQLTQDQDANIPLWIAEILEKQGFVEIQLDEVVSPSSLNRIVRKEGDDHSLTPVSSLLFRRVRIEIERLRKENNTNALRRLASIEGSFNSILRLRNKKILNLAFGGQLGTKARSELTTEELWLYKHLQTLFEIYANSIGSSTEKLSD